MRSKIRLSFVALIFCALSIFLAAPVAQAQEFPGIETFAGINCNEESEECANEKVTKTTFEAQHYSVPVEPETPEQSEEEGFLTAGGHVPFGITDFKVTTIEEGEPNVSPGELPTQVPTAVIKHIRTDVAPGLATNPQAVPTCPASDFGVEIIPGSTFFTAPECEEDTEIGEQQATVYGGPFGDLGLFGAVYNLEPPEGRASDYGVAVKLPILVTEAVLELKFAELGNPYKKIPNFEKELEEKQWYSHSEIEGNVEWGKEAKGTNQGDYHDYFEVNVSTGFPLISSRLNFYGRTGGDFITNATSCPGHNTTTLKLTDVEGTTIEKPYTTLVGLQECKNLPYEPGFAVTPGNTNNDQPDSLTTEFSLPQFTGEEEVTSSQVKTATVTLPEGMTLNPSAAAGLEACTPAQARIHSEVFGVECPEGSEIGTVALEVPGLPKGSLTGSVYLGGPESGPITGPPYIMYVVANSKRYGVSVRLKGEVVPNEATGQITTIFNENPEQPFNSLTLRFNRGALTPVANPLACGTATGSATFTPVADEGVPNANDAFGVSITGCGDSLPFALSQATEYDTPTAGSHTSYDFKLGRADGQQYLQKVKTTLPAGVVGAIPAITLCGEPQAAAGTCASSSRIGTATVTAGAGNSPYTFTGPVYMTGPYAGAPFGLSIAVPAVAGPFNLGTIVTRSTININQRTSRVTAESTLPTIVKGVPIRLRSLSVNVTKQGFLYNPTSCAVEATETTLTSTLGTTQTLSTPFQVENCGALAFKPGFTASTSAKASKANGASLVTTMTATPGQANIKSVFVQLPKQLPSRLSTLNKACLAKTFEQNPYSCPKESMVGTVTANTPLLPEVMKGSAIFVSHAGEEFPSLELVLEADNVRVIVEGKTRISKGITTTNFAATPDVPVSSITVNLPLGPFSALALERYEAPNKTNPCTANLVMPTTITGQNGTVVKQNTTITPTECGVQILSHKVKGNTASVTVQTYSAGSVTLYGKHLKRVDKTYTEAKKSVTIKVPLSSKGASLRRPFKLKLKVNFKPKQKGEKSSSASATVKF